MNDLISRQAAIEAINKIAPVDTEYDCKLLDRIDVRYVLIELPSAQTEIVRCKDCKYFTLNYVENVDGIPLIVAHEVCSFWGDGCKTSQEGFCSYGERKEE